MKHASRHLTYANVLATLTLFAVLVGGTAYAANQLAKNSVGKKQLQAKAVTTAKLKKNAVTGAKIKKNAVTGAKVKSGSLGDSELSGEVPFTKIVQEIRGSGSVSLPSEISNKLVPFSIDGAYTQPAGRSDSYLGFAEVNISSACKDPEFTVALEVDASNPAELSMADIQSVVGLGVFQAQGTAPGVHRVTIGPYPSGGSRVAPSEATPHNLTIGTKIKCSSGEGATVTAVGADVIGTR